MASLSDSFRKLADQIDEAEADVKPRTRRARPTSSPR